MADTIAPGTWKQHIDDVVPKLEERNTKFITGYKLCEMKEDCVVLESTEVSGRIKRIMCDNVVLALGVKKNGLSDEIKALSNRVFQVGDALQIGRVANATHTAYKAAMLLK